MKNTFSIEEVPYHLMYEPIVPKHNNFRADEYMGRTRCLTEEDKFGEILAAVTDMECEMFIRTTDGEELKLDFAHKEQLGKYLDSLDEKHKENVRKDRYDVYMRYFNHNADR